MDIQEKLLAAGLRSTQQRLLIGEWLFSGVDKHFTAEDMYGELKFRGAAVSLATIYNTLGTFTKAGLLHTVSVEGDRVFYDTNTRHHYHLYDESLNELTDFDAGSVVLSDLPQLPDGKTVDRIDIIIRTKPVA